MWKGLGDVERNKGCGKEKGGGKEWEEMERNEGCGKE